MENAADPTSSALPYPGCQAGQRDRSQPQHAMDLHDHEKASGRHHWAQLAGSTMPMSWCQWNASPRYNSAHDAIVRRHTHKQATFVGSYQFWYRKLKGVRAHGTVPAEGILLVHTPSTCTCTG